MTLTIAPFSDEFNNDGWKEQPESSPDPALNFSTERYGLCLNCALQFARTRGPLGQLPAAFVDGDIPPREHWMSKDEYRRAWRDHGYRAALLIRAQSELTLGWSMSDREADFAARLLAWPRCSECPSWISENEFSPSTASDDAPTPRRCRQCSRLAHLEGELNFPNFPIEIFARHDLSEDEIAAFWISNHASLLIQNARKSLLRNQPRCEGCPSTLPTKPSRETGLEQKVLSALAGHAAPMSVGELLAADVKALTKNNVAKIMRELTDSGRVLMTTRGPAKYFALP